MPSTILLIDDDGITAQVTAACLRTAGYEVTEARDASQGFQVANRDRPALILLDIMLPGGGGLEVLERLTRSSRTQGIPVLVTSEGTRQDLEAYVRSKGASGFLGKPAKNEALVGAVARFLGPPGSGPVRTGPGAG